MEQIEFGNYRRANDLDIYGGRGNTPDWIKRAKRNHRAKVRYYVNRYGWSIEKAEKHLMDKSEWQAMDEDGN